ncbi:fimbrial protein [Burkholderia stabilis]|uniref:fimbrial protein n=1 Tax=Burkholderia stabilis TaxID=95485 RepID=UPI001F4A9C6C|nr:fimbrial protein [Burkholderia stabilis]
MKRFGHACLLVAFFVMSGSAWAQIIANGCIVQFPNGTSWPGAPGYSPIVYEAPSFNVSFNPNVPDGTIIFRKEIDLTSTGGRLECYHYYEVPLRWLNTVGPLTSKRQFYQTSIPGVAMAITTGAYTWPRTEYRMGPFTASFDYSARLTITLAKIGKITAGGVITGEVGRMDTYYSIAYPPVASYRFGRGIVIDPQVPTCRVTTPAITVPLGNVRASTFTGVGSVSTGQPFNIVLECAGGETGTVTNVYTTLTDHTNPGNVSDTLSLAQDSGATGIGIQVLNGSTVIKYGPDSSAAGNTNQWKAGEAGNGTFTIPLTARYVQTAPKITPGSANGLATFTMSYQ